MQFHILKIGKKNTWISITFKILPIVIHVPSWKFHEFIHRPLFQNPAYRATERLTKTSTYNTTWQRQSLRQYYNKSNYPTTKNSSELWTFMLDYTISESVTLNRLQLTVQINTWTLTTATASITPRSCRNYKITGSSPSFLLLKSWIIIDNIFPWLLTTW